jgi:hypothetical protein
VAPCDQKIQTVPLPSAHVLRWRRGLLLQSFDHRRGISRMIQQPLRKLAVGRDSRTPARKRLAVRLARAIL